MSAADAERWAKTRKWGIVYILAWAAGTAFVLFLFFYVLPHLTFHRGITLGRGILTVMGVVCAWVGFAQWLMHETAYQRFLKGSNSNTKSDQTDKPWEDH